MKFKRIDVDTVRCLISEEELWERGLELEDFLQSDKKAEEFLREIIAMAAEEVGYRVKGGNVSIQVSVLPDHVLALTFSEKPDGGIMNMLEYLKQAMENLSKNIDDAADMAGDTLLAERTKSHSGKQSGTGKSTGEKLSKLPTRGKMNYQICFDSLEIVEEYCKSVELEVEIENSLYKLTKESVYFILMEKGSMTDKQLCRLLGAALDFASDIYASEPIRAYIMEHGEAVVEKQAIQTMQSL